MEISLGAEEIINEQKRIIGDLQHELMLRNLMVKKMGEEVQKYQQADAVRNAAVPLPELQRQPAVAAEQTPESNA